MAKNRILLVDDDLDIYCAIKDRLQNKNTEIYYTDSASKALDSFMNQDFCLVIMNNQLSEMFNTQILQIMRNIKHTPILVISDPLSSEDKVAVFQAGANAIIDKPVDINICVAQARSLIQLYSGVDSDNCEKDELKFGTKLKIVPHFRQALIDGRALSLTRKEFDLLHFFACHPYRVYSREQLYSYIWEDSFVTGGDETVKVHIQTLRKKLETEGLGITPCPGTNTAWCASPASIAGRRPNGGCGTTITWSGSSSWMWPRPTCWWMTAGSCATPISPPSWARRTVPACSSWTAPASPAGSKSGKKCWTPSTALLRKRAKKVTDCGARSISHFHPVCGSVFGIWDPVLNALIFKAFFSRHREKNAQVLATLGVNQTLRGCKKVTVTEKCQLPDPDSFSALLLTMIAMSGEFPMALGRRFPSPTYADFVVKRLKHNGLIRTYYRNGLRGLRLTAQAKKLLAASNPARFTPLFIGDTMTNAPKYTLVHRLRLHRMAEVLVAMFNAGVSPYIEQPAYYSSYELKRSIGEMANKIRGSRASGVLLTQRDIFVVYNTGSSEMKWAYKAEVRLKALLQMGLCQKRGPAQYADVKQSAILFGADMGRLLPMIGVDSDNNQNYFLSGQGFIHFYYLTCDHHGEVILQLLCDPDEKDRLDDLLAHGLSDPRPGWRVDNDAMDGDSPVLFGYICDMPRIKRFDARLSQHELAGTLICFDFQEKALRQLCGPNVSLQCIDFDNYERSVFHQPQEFD